LNPRFLEELKNLKKETIGKLSAKMIKSTVLNGNMYVEYLKLIVKAINEEKTIYIQDALEKIEAEEILNEIKKKYVDGLTTNLDKSAINTYDTYLNSYGFSRSNLSIKHLKTMNQFHSAISEITRKFTEELKSKIGKLLIDEYMEKFNSFKKEKDEVYLEKNKAKIREHNFSLALGIWNKNIKPKVDASSFQNLWEFDRAVVESKKEFKLKSFDLNDQEADSVWEETMKKVNLEIVRRNIQEKFDSIEREKEKERLEKKIKQLEYQRKLEKELV